MKIGKSRKPNRLRHFDYSANGWYFVTICTKDKEKYFGKIENNTMILNELGEMVREYWLVIPEHFPYVILDEFIIMPNHIHGIIVIEHNNYGVGNNDRCSLQRNRNMQLLPKIISQYKSSVTRDIRKQFNNYRFRWQKSFFDHIIRDETSLQNIRTYIRFNPLKWNTDTDNPKNTL